jgi:hypothetical protein
MTQEDKDEINEVLDALPYYCRTMHGTICEWGEAVNCPAENKTGPCECGCDEHNRGVDAKIAELKQLLMNKGIL